MAGPKETGNPRRGSLNRDGIARLKVFPGEYRMYVLADDSRLDLVTDADCLKARENDFPPVQVAAGAKAAGVTVTMR